MFLDVGVGQVVLRIMILFVFALAVVRFMGNRTVGQLSPFDFVIMVGIGDIIITASMDEGQQIVHGAAALVALLVLQQLFSYISLKSPRLRRWIEGTPVLLIKNGILLRENFVKTHFNYDDLRQELHRQGMDMRDVTQIEEARLESCGVFTVVKKPDSEPLTRKELEQYITGIIENPLSPLGQEWAALRQEIREVAGFVRQQQATPKDAQQDIPASTH